MRDSLHKDDDLDIILVVDEDSGALSVEIESTEAGPDLSVADEVVVAVDGEPCSLQVEGPRRARAAIGHADDFTDKSFELMVRVHEFFDGWEFEPEDDD
ncbi:MAG: hypothetical protein ACNA8W_24405 [Bradymonadaceae bacterium]